MLLLMACSTERPTPPLTSSVPQRRWRGPMTTRFPDAPPAPPPKHHDHVKEAAATMLRTTCIAVIARAAAFTIWSIFKLRAATSRGSGLA